MYPKLINVVNKNIKKEKKYILQHFREGHSNMAPLKVTSFPNYVIYWFIMIWGILIQECIHSGQKILSQVKKCVFWLFNF